MDTADKDQDRFEVPVQSRLALMWTSLMFLYVYNDYFSLYVPGTIEGMAKGAMGPLGEATQGVLTGVSLLLAVPALMITLSVSLRRSASRWANLLFGAAYTLVELSTLFGSPLFYQVVVVLEMALTASIVWNAWRWPAR